MRYAITLLILILGLPEITYAQDKQGAEPANKQSEFGKRLEDYLKENQQKKIETFPPAFKEERPKNSEEFGNRIQPDVESLLISQGLDKLDESTKAKVLASFNEYLEYRVSGYQNRREVFRWQLYSSKIIFYVVIFLVLTGVYFSGIHFHRALWQKRANISNAKDAIIVSDAAEKVGTVKDEATQVVPTERDEVTEISASVKGIKVSSPILGVIILVISLLFFYLYLKFVYPIEEIL